MSNRSTYIPLHGDVYTNRKTIAAAKALTKGDVHLMVGHLGRLWTWAIDRNDDGNLEHLTDQMIADAAGWNGYPKRFVKALIEAGFIDADRRLHDWKLYGGQLARTREVDRKRQQNKRDLEKKLELEAAKQAETLMLSDGHPPTVPMTSERSRAEPTVTEPNETDSPPSGLEGAERLGLAKVSTILAESKHRDAFEGKLSALAAVMVRYPDRDAIQTARDIVEKMNDQIASGPAFFETWLINAGKVKPPERSYTVEESIHRSLRDGESCGRDDCSICGGRLAPTR